MDILGDSKLTKEIIKEGNGDGPSKGQLVKGNINCIEVKS